MSITPYLKYTIQADVYYRDQIKVSVVETERLNFLMYGHGAQ